MTKLLFALMLTLSALPAFAQNYRTCQVAAIDRYNTIIARFYGTRDPRGVCREPIMQCQYEMRRRGWYDTRCVEYRSRW